MKNFLLISVLFIGTVFSSSAQSWQWIKDGGSDDVLATTSNLRQEEVYSIVTDSEKNIYTLSAVGKSSLNIDGNPKTNYGDDTTLTDYAISSFSCNGTYRWSKIIGGGGYENIYSIQIDAQDNIYVAGRFGTCGFNDPYPPRIDNDVIISQNPEDCSLLFIAKYNKNGVMQWFKRPQPNNVSSTIGYQTSSKSFSTDLMGNSYWLVMIPPGTYADGAFVNGMTGNNWFVFKYDTNGNFTSATYLDMQLTYDFLLQLKFYRNPNNGYFYMSSMRYDNGATPDATAVIAGQTVTHSAFIACFNDLGQFQWKKENTNTPGGSLFIYNLDFDNQNNIYLGGRLIGMNLDSFLGLTIPEPIATSFVMKVNPTASTLLWSTYYNHNGSPNVGAVLVNGSEVGFTGYCFSSNFTWGTQSIFASNTNQGTEVLFARFNATTGACTALNKIPGDVGYGDAGTALAVDASGDYILGGGFGHYLYDVNNNFVINSGSQTDFFVAKFATQACSPLSTEEFDKDQINIFPNPVTDVFAVSVKENMQYELYTITGILVAKGSLTQQQSNIDIQKLASGCYLLHLKNEDGSIKVVKVLKN
jgi:hypothetical protein